ncbi:MAG: ABC transporter permease, partial [Ruminococcus sp.]|nr:ABC transporter permease [Ruminococcus sp.]
MYLSILKKDLKRKKTMNCILLLFIILSAMFAASSVNNIMAVLTGRDSYFDKAGVKDYFIISRGEKLGEDSELYTILKNSSVVTDIAREECIYITDSNIRYPDGRKVYEFTNASDINSIDRVTLNYFDKDNNVIKDVPKGKIYANTGFFRSAELKEGDRINIEMDGTLLELEVAGSFKDAPLGSDMMGVKRFLINDDDYKTLLANEKITANNMGCLYYADTTDIETLEKELADVDGIYFKGDKDLLKTTYFMDLSVAAMILVLSIFLVVISFVVLRFTIGFTIAEEFREIGVMKAIGIKNSSIRALYLIKYLGIAIIGAVIGFFLSTPFGDMLLSSVSSNMVLENENRTLMSFIYSMSVVVIIMLFGWRCTGRIKKLSPIDAVRNGQTGERFRKRSIMSLSKSRLGTAPFLAANDILSSPRRYSIITIIFTLCMLLVMILSTTSNSMNSAEMVTLLSVKPSDAYVAYASAQFDILNGRKTEQEAEDEILKKLNENGMSGDVRIELMALINATLGDRQKKITFQHCSHTDASDYDYTEGSAPQNKHEIALTEPAADSLGARIGDKVTLDIGGKREEYLVTALYGSFTQGGESGR